jgi:hypothetical protein
MNVSIIAFFLKTCWKIKDETIAKISYLFTLVETLMAGIPKFVLRMDNLKAEWISLRSSLMVGLSMKLEQFQLIRQQLGKKRSSHLKEMFLESANQLLAEILDVNKKIKKFDSKFSAVLKGEVEKSEIDDVAYLKEKEMTFLEGSVQTM